MSDDDVREKPALPDEVAWAAAVEAAGFLLGSTPERALHAESLERLEAELRGRLEHLAGPAAELPVRLAEWAALAGVDGGADRLVTARSGDALIAALAGQRAAAQVKVLATFQAQTSARAVGTSLRTAPELVKLLGDATVRGVFEQLAARRGLIAGAEDVLGRAAEALRQDELHVALVERLRSLADVGQRLLALPLAIAGKRVDDDTLAAGVPAGKVIERRGAGHADALAALEAAVREARAEIDRLGDRAEIEVDIVVHERRR